MPRADFNSDAISKIPSEAGVYQFLDAEGKVIYVGKAAELRGRVRQYLNQTDHASLRGATSPGVPSRSSSWPPAP